MRNHNNSRDPETRDAKFRVIKKLLDLSQFVFSHIIKFDKYISFLSYFYLFNKYCYCLIDFIALTFYQIMLSDEFGLSSELSCYIFNVIVSEISRSLGAL